MMLRIKLVLATGALLLVSALGSVAPVPQAAADDGFDISFFYNALAPHGEWVNVQPYGWSWMPEKVDYGWRPYTVGHWAWIQPYGWTWISAEPWGWATYHYGRWTWVEDYGWLWVPGSVWSPAWVAFRYGDPWVGWAPMPPGANWRYDSGLDVGALNRQLDIGTYAWSFVPMRYFGEPDLRSRYYVPAYNPYLVQRTAWSTRYATVEGGVANLSIDPATVEKTRGSPLPRYRLRDASAPDEGATRVEGDAVHVFRPRIVPKAPAAAPPAPRRLAEPGAGTVSKADLDAWAAERKAALKAHLEAERKALEAQEKDVAPPPTAQPKPGVGADDAAKRREAALKALEEEQKRTEALIERQRLRREREAQQLPPPKAPPAGMGDDHPGMGDDSSGMGEGHGGGMK